jgi:hypothetical protein
MVPAKATKHRGGMQGDTTTGKLNTLTWWSWRWWRWRWWWGAGAGIRSHWDLADSWLNRAAGVGVGPGVPCGCRGVVVGGPCSDVAPTRGVAKEVAIGLSGSAHKACVGGGALQGGVCVVPPAQQCSVHE